MRIGEIQRPNFGQPIFKQLCQNIGKGDTLVDSAKGYYLYRPGRKNEGAADILTASKARASFREAVISACDEDLKTIKRPSNREPVVSDTILTKWKKSRCVEVRGSRLPACCTKAHSLADASCDCSESARQFATTICFVQHGEAWKVGLLSTVRGGESLNKEDMNRFVSKAANWYR